MLPSHLLLVVSSFTVHPTITTHFKFGFILCSPMVVSRIYFVTLVFFCRILRSLTNFCLCHMFSRIAPLAQNRYHATRI